MHTEVTNRNVRQNFQSFLHIECRLELIYLLGAVTTYICAFAAPLTSVYIHVDFYVYILTQHDFLVQAVLSSTAISSVHKIRLHVPLDKCLLSMTLQTSV